MNIVWKKLQKCLSIGGSAPEPPFASDGWSLHPQFPALLLLSAITAMSNSFLALNAFNYP